MAKKKEFTPKERKFILTYCSNGYNGSQAAIKAGYAKHSARITASKLLTKSNIKKEVARLQGDFESLMAEHGITKTIILMKHWEIASTSIASLHNTWIERKDFEKLTPEQRACISEIETKIEYKKDPEGFKGKKKIEFIKIKLYDKQKALDSISKLMGYDAPTKQEVDIKGLQLIVDKHQKDMIDKLD